MSATEEAVILSAVRTPIGKYLGALSSFSAVAVHCMRARLTAREEVWDSGEYGQLAWQS